MELPASDAGQVHQKAKGHLEVLTFRFRLRENIFEITTIIPFLALLWPWYLKAKHMTITMSLLSISSTTITTIIIITITIIISLTPGLEAWPCLSDWQHRCDEARRADSTQVKILKKMARTRKMSHSGLAVAQLVKEAGFPPGVVNVVPG